MSTEEPVGTRTCLPSYRLIPRIGAFPLRHTDISTKTLKL